MPGWKRFRRWIKKKPSAQELARKIAELKALVKLAQLGHITLYFADEAGFSLTPYVPYGWQPIGQQVGMVTQKKQVANVLGLLNPLNDRLLTYTAQDKETINSEFVIKRFHDLAEGLQQETVVVLDNAAPFRLAI